MDGGEEQVAGAIGSLPTGLDALEEFLGVFAPVLFFFLRVCVGLTGLKYLLPEGGIVWNFLHGFAFWGWTFFVKYYTRVLTLRVFNFLGGNFFETSWLYRYPKQLSMLNYC